MQENVRKESPGKGDFFCRSQAFAFLTRAPVLTIEYRSWAPLYARRDRSNQRPYRASFAVSYFSSSGRPFPPPPLPDQRNATKHNTFQSKHLPTSIKCNKTQHFSTKTPPTSIKRNKTQHFSTKTPPPYQLNATKHNTFQPKTPPTSIKCNKTQHFSTKTHPHIN